MCGRLTRQLLRQLHHNTDPEWHEQGARFEQLQHTHMRFRLLGYTFKNQNKNTMVASENSSWVSDWMSLVQHTEGIQLANLPSSRISSMSSSIWLDALNRFIAVRN